MAGWYHRLNGHESEQTQGGSEEEKYDVLQFMESQRVGYDLATEQQQQHLISKITFICTYKAKEIKLDVKIIKHENNCS